MKIKLLLLILIVFLFGTVDCKATPLPKEVKQFVLSQKKIPSIRYDGIIVYNNNLMYLPVFPAYPEEVESLEIVKTYPENQTMMQFPDMILFNNNMSLLKVIRTGDNSLTVRNIPDMPIELRSGLLPQDIMVPRGLVFPDSLAGILGDVQIPLTGSAKVERKPAPLPNGKRVEKGRKYNVPKELKDKLFFVNNFQTEYLQVFSSTVSEPLYSLKTSGVMKDIKPVLDGKFILAATNNKKNIDVIDIQNEYVAKRIDLTAIPSEIAVDNKNKKAYVASVRDESVTIINLDTMAIEEKIQLVGAPQRLSISNDGTKLAYVDLKTSGIYILDLEDDYSNKLISSYPNATKLILGDNVLYVIARTQPKLRLIYFDLLQDNKVTKTKRQLKKEEEQKKLEAKDAETLNDDIFIDEDIFDGEEEELAKDAKTYSTSIKDVKVGDKPVDLYMKNDKLYVLCAGNNSVYTYDTINRSTTEYKLPMDGFSKAITPVPNSDFAVITNMSDLKYVVYDLKQGKSVETMPISEYINMITILERNNE